LSGTWNGDFWLGYDNYYRPRLSDVSLPSGAFDDGALVGLLDQLDLNKGESVLLYSGILQAVPLVGSVFKMTSILNKAARNLSKSFRKKPFTTVVKSLISADFVDRFVISPTIDDARRFADATDYVLRVIQTAQERSAHIFALQTDLKSIVSQSSGSIDVGSAYGSIPPMKGCRWRKQQTLESKAFMLCSARYDIGAISPLKLWARRVGLTRPLDSVWDLVPFSFVIDYFTRAGDFISALSDEMSDQDGLRATCVNILDLWQTFTRKGEHVVEGGDVQSWASYDWWASHCQTINQSQVQGTAYLRNVEFQRQRISNPWARLLPLQERIDDYLTVNLDLSSTRKRTIAELVIQAKL
jgi:hypothetical protein